MGVVRQWLLPLLCGSITTLLCGPALADLTPQQQAAIVHVQAGRAGGTGFYVAPGGKRQVSIEVRTAAHVVSGSPWVTVNGVPATVKWIDPETDQAALVGTTSTVWLSRGKTGDYVAAYGDFGDIRCAAGEFLDSHSNGLQHATAQVCGGFSGGPVINRQTNRVVGVVSMRTVTNMSGYGDLLYVKVR